MSLVPTIDPHEFSKIPGGRLISHEAASFFENASLITPPVNNKRKISVTALLNPSSPVSPIQQNEAEVPEYLHSIETLEIMGFNHNVAYDIWSRYITGDPDSPFDFMDYAHARIKFSDRIPGGLSTSEDWDDIMTKLGINCTLRAAILVPGFDDIRGTASCKHWIWEAMKMRFEALDNLIDDISCEYERRKAAEAGDREDNRDPPASLTEAPASLDGHSMLWRACTKPAAESCANAPQRLKFPSMTVYPGDFEGHRIYFTPQYQTANRFAAYLKHLASLAEIALLQIAVPNDFIETLSKNYLFSDGPSSSAWREVVWHHRRGRPLNRSYMEEMCAKKLWIGHILLSERARFNAVDGYATLQCSDALMVEVDGKWQKAEQWSFSGPEVQAKFAKRCKGKALVHSVGRLIES